MTATHNVSMWPVITCPWVAGFTRPPTLSLQTFRKWRRGHKINLRWNGSYTENLADSPKDDIIIMKTNKNIKCLAKDLTSGPTWYAIHTHSRHEQVVHDYLCKMGFESFLPKIETWSKRKDRRQRIKIPMFSGYLFVFTDIGSTEYVQVLKCPGVVKLVQFAGRPVPVNPAELDSVRILINSGEAISPVDYLNVGDMVEIIDGPFKGVIGRIVRSRSAHRLIVSVDAINRSVCINVHEDLLCQAQSV